MMFFLIVFLLFILIFIGVIFLTYWIPKKLGYRKIGLIISSTLIIFFVSITIFFVFEDEFFSKNDALELLGQNNILLEKECKLIDNESMTAIGDYYHTFTLEISERDKWKIISEIKKSKNFMKSDTNIVDISSLTNNYTGQEVIQNYESRGFFVKKIFRPVGEGFAPIYRVITVDKNDNTLVFEEIDE